MRKAVGFTALLFFLSLVYAGYDFRGSFERLVESADIEDLESYNMVVFYHWILGVKHPKVVAGQVWLETGRLTSTIAQENDNWHGMKCDTDCYCEGTVRGHAYYSHPVFSILSYKCWQDKRLKDNPGVVTDEDYINMLDDYRIPGKCAHCRYAEDLNYTDKLRVIIKQNDVEWNISF
jgi:hypothetical protein